MEQGIILNCLAYAASKLWNAANYERVNWTEESGGKYPDWFDQKSRMKENFWYKTLSSQTAQELLKQLDEAWQSFCQLKKTGGIQNPKPPGYKHSNFNLRYLNNGFIVKEKSIRLTIPKQQKQYLKLKHGIEADFLYIPIPNEYKGYKGNTKVVEIIPGKEKYILLSNCQNPRKNRITVYIWA